MRDQFSWFNLSLTRSTLLLLKVELSEHLLFWTSFVCGRDQRWQKFLTFLLMLRTLWLNSNSLNLRIYIESRKNAFVIRWVVKNLFRLNSAKFVNWIGWLNQNKSFEYSKLISYASNVAEQIVDNIVLYHAHNRPLLL